MAGPGHGAEETVVRTSALDRAEVGRSRERGDVDAPARGARRAGRGRTSLGAGVGVGVGSLRAGGDRGRGGG
eukprot:7240640-Alexandrium_andersonii.AAC.1